MSQASEELWVRTLGLEQEAVAEEAAAGVEAAGVSKEKQLSELKTMWEMPTLTAIDARPEQEAERLGLGAAG